MKKIIFVLILLTFYLGAILGQQSDTSKEQGDGSVIKVNEITYNEDLYYGVSLPISSIPNKTELTLPQFLETKEYFPVPGDIFTIKIITSRGEKIDFEIIVQNNYTLQIPYLGSYNIRNRNYHSLRQHVIKTINEMIAPLYIDFTFSSPSSFKVLITGAVKIEGDVFANSLLTLGEVIYLAGGLESGASYRKIEITNTNDNSNKIIDLSKYTLTGEQKYNPYIRSGDKIKVPYADRIVSIEGEIKNPGRYELLENENFLDLVKFSGGFTNKANTKSFLLERFLADGKFTSFKISYSELKNIELQDGDKIIVYDANINPPTVTIKGALFGKPFNVGDKLSDIPKEIISETRPYYPGITLMEVLNEYGGPTPYAGSDGIILNKLTDSKRYYDVFKTWRGEENIQLSPWDIVIVPMESVNVSIQGEVLRPGTYELYPGQNLKDLISMSGGFTPEAERDSIRLLRLEKNGKYNFILINYPNDNEIILEDGDKIIVESGSLNAPLVLVEGALIGKPYSGTNPIDIPTTELSGNTAEEEIIKSEVPIPITAKLPYYEGMNLEQILTLLGGPSPYAKGDLKIFRDNEIINFDVFEIWKNKGEAAEIKIYPGDHIVIPIERQIVAITGEVATQKLLPYQKGQPLYEYILLCGGINKEGDKNQIFLKDKKGYKKMRIKHLEYVPSPGDIIYVDQKLGVKIRNNFNVIFPTIVSLSSLIFSVINIISSLK